MRRYVAGKPAVGKKATHNARGSRQRFSSSSRLVRVPGRVDRHHQYGVHCPRSTRGSTSSGFWDPYSQTSHSCRRRERGECDQDQIGTVNVGAMLRPSSSERSAGLALRERADGRRGGARRLLRGLIVPRRFRATLTGIVDSVRQKPNIQWPSTKNNAVAPKITGAGATLWTVDQ